MTEDTYSKLVLQMADRLRGRPAVDVQNGQIRSSIADWIVCKRNHTACPKLQTLLAQVYMKLDTNPEVGVRMRRLVEYCEKITNVSDDEIAESLKSVLSD